MPENMDNLSEAIGRLPLTVLILLMLLKRLLNIVVGVVKVARSQEEVSVVHWWSMLATER